MSFGTRFGKKVLDHLFMNTDIGGLESAIFVSLHTAAPGEDGQTSNEVSGGSYARVSTVGSDWDAAGGTDPASIANGNSIDFPTASANWASSAALTYFGLWNHLTTAAEDNYFGDGTINGGSGKVVEDNDTPKFAAGALTFTLD